MLPVPEHGFKFPQARLLPQRCTGGRYISGAPHARRKVSNAPQKPEIFGLGGDAQSRRATRLFHFFSLILTSADDADSFVALTALGLSCGLAHAQLNFPRRPDREPERDAETRENAGGQKSGEAAKGEKVENSALAPSPHAVADKVLRLNGSQGQFLLSDRDKALRIEKLSLSGEVISDPSRKCLIDIVADAPIETKSLGKPDGLARYEAEISRLHLHLRRAGRGGAGPPQDRACVFQAADCQATPAGLWGPDPATLHSDAKAIGRQRLRSDEAADRTMRAIQTKLKGQPDAERDQARGRRSGGAPRRRLPQLHPGGRLRFCASRMAQARAAYLKARLDGLKTKPTAERD